GPLTLQTARVSVETSLGHKDHHGADSVFLGECAVVVYAGFEVKGGTDVFASFGVIQVIGPAVGIHIGDPVGAALVIYTRRNAPERIVEPAHIEKGAAVGIQHPVKG